ncbi:uracil-DNA glycosylase [Paracoccus sp. (in: a-proteobacteria)]|uniref:uracil-DNA glycosylase n=1 Tax=Paracoccus sp. TaxID=267 RepID=UPI0026E104DF|nr:uracil-DNA glycosylase [Paracoccus sp. (in: a-proteobacteria)]MDO5370819.1 uracil-DNA glycosylase [Paracoccus sp. (in: a-proteobacteria)]
MTAEPTWRGTTLDAETALALLEWQREMGVDEPILNAPVDRYAEPVRPPVARPEPAAPMTSGQGTGALPGLERDGQAGQAAAMAARARTLAELSEIQSGFEELDIRRGARNFVFSDGNPSARVMILGEAPGEEEDRQGRPFVGRSGQLLDRMFEAIGLSRQAADAERALYITNVLPWRPPGNRRPEQAEIDAMLPFVARHVELAAPDFLVLMGNAACKAALGRDGILRLRGHWTEAFGRPALPMTHPAYLLRNPTAKREAWADLLSLSARLQAGSQP